MKYLASKFANTGDKLCSKCGLWVTNEKTYSSPKFPGAVFCSDCWMKEQSIVKLDSLPDWFIDELKSKIESYNHEIEELKKGGSIGGRFISIQMKCVMRNMENILSWKPPEEML